MKACFLGWRASHWPLHFCASSKDKYTHTSKGWWNYTCENLQILTSNLNLRPHQFPNWLPLYNWIQVLWINTGRHFLWKKLPCNSMSEGLIWWTSYFLCNYVCAEICWTCCLFSLTKTFGIAIHGHEMVSSFWLLVVVSIQCCVWMSLNCIFNCGVSKVVC